MLRDRSKTFLLPWCWAPTSRCEIKENEEEEDCFYDTQLLQMRFLVALRKVISFNGYDKLQIQTYKNVVLK